MKIPTRIRTALLALLAVVALAPVSAHAAPAPPRDAAVVPSPVVADMHGTPSITADTRPSSFMTYNNVYRYTNAGTYSWSWSWRVYGIREIWVPGGSRITVECWQYGDTIAGWDNIWYRAWYGGVEGYIQDYRVNSNGVPDIYVSACVY